MSDDICNAIDWVGCTTNSPDHAHEIRMKAHKALASLRAENEKLRRALHDIYEVYAGIDGYLFDESKAYREQIVVGMSKIAAEHKR